MCYHQTYHPFTCNRHGCKAILKAKPELVRCQHARRTPSPSLRCWDPTAPEIPPIDAPPAAQERARDRCAACQARQAEASAHREAAAAAQAAEGKRPFARLLARRRRGGGGAKGEKGGEAAGGAAADDGGGTKGSGQVALVAGWWKELTGKVVKGSARFGNGRRVRGEMGRMEGVGWGSEEELLLGDSRA
ncbi:270a4311-eaf5-4f71-97a9-435ba04e2cde [Thermothielavioides terrestris]|uniref:270a4311-eaf5-4f71-97a9-435ba04e2cde n=1 Tax=Thermothielavioides terrestris TaxID=2587410 RepID=A0A3S4F3A6_9PEZI|nr:270a4311-eaf5-4f71-97a9-435ba04e2cde [Thermothielavioides terrestris]